MSGACAVIGIGQTRYAAARTDVTLGGLVREAAERALADAGLDWREVDAVVLGKAPDMLEGVMSPELHLADALGAAGKPLYRAYTSGSAGGVAASTGVALIRSGLHARVLVVCFEKQSEARATGATLQPVPFEAAWHGGTGSLFAAVCQEYIARSGAPPRTGDLVALKERRHAVLNPYAQIRKPGLTLEDITASRMLWDPIRLLHSSPSSDGACAVVLADAATAKAAAKGRPGPAWVLGCAVRSEPAISPRHDNVDPRAGRDCAAAVYAEAGITDPVREIDVAELFIPYSWLEPAILENLHLAGRNEGWKLAEREATALGGPLPVNPSGGLLGANPIGAAGLVRFAEAALQVRGGAGEHQVEGARIALGHAAGGYSNCVAAWIVASEPR